MSESSVVQQKQLVGKDVTGSGNHQLPPRLAQHRFSGNRLVFNLQHASTIAMTQNSLFCPN